MMLEVILLISYVVLAVVFIVMARQLYRAVKKFTPPQYTSKLGSEIDLPSVTVCIPARNEQHALTACLEKVIGSTYDRLEIIVLDDESKDDTSALIKAFAREGVRFVRGKSVPAGWLGKNNALQGLLNEASGSYILFMDVDTHLQPKAIENMVRYSLAQGSAMLSVLPFRNDGWRGSVLLSPLRYFWELIFNRSQSPAAASNAWLIHRETLIKDFNGFNELKNTAQPEAKIAAELSAKNRYKFLISSGLFGVHYEKKWSSQVDTSIRLLYPLLGKQVALATIAILDLLMLTIPFIALIPALFGQFAAIQIPALILAIAFCSLYGWYVHRVWRSGWVAGALLWPVIVLQEAILATISMVQYNRKTVKWKGRSIQPEAQN